MQSNICAFSLKIQKKERPKVVTNGNQSHTHAHMFDTFFLSNLIKQREIR